MKKQNNNLIVENIFSSEQSVCDFNECLDKLSILLWDNGSIIMKSNDPAEDFQFNMNAGMGSDNFKEYGFIANFKLLNGNYLRVNANKNYQDGFRENDFLGKNNTFGNIYIRSKSL